MQHEKSLPWSCQGGKNRTCGLNRVVTLWFLNLFKVNSVMLQPECRIPPILDRGELQISMEDCLLEVLEFQFSFALEDVSIERHF